MAQTTITIATRSEELVDFPVVIDLSILGISGAFWSAVDRDNLRAFNSTGTTQLPLDIYNLDPVSQTGVIVVKQTLSAVSNTEILLDTDGVGEALPSDPLGAEAVWSDYASVVFGIEGVDRTDFSRSFSLIGVDQIGISALPKEGIRFLENQDRVEGPVVGNSPAFTMSVTASNDFDSGSDQAIISYNTGTTANTRANISYRFGSAVLFDNTNGLTGSSGSINAGEENRFSAVYDGISNRKLFVSGVLAAEDTSTTNISAGLDRIWVGAEDASLSETLGEGNASASFAYIRLESLSDEWLAAEHSNILDPQSFFIGVVNPAQTLRITQSANLLLSEGSSNTNITQSAILALATQRFPFRITQSANLILTETPNPLRVTQWVALILAGDNIEPVPAFEFSLLQDCPLLDLPTVNNFFEKVEIDLNDRPRKDGSIGFVDDLRSNFQRWTNAGEAVSGSDAVTLGQLKKLIEEAKNGL